MLLGLAASWAPPAGRRAMRIGTGCVRAVAEPHRNGARGACGLPKGVEGLSSNTSAASFIRESSVALPDLERPFCVLGIETSCDDTGVAVVRSDGTILGEALASQAALHEEFGGVMPSVARDAHAENLERVTAEALRRAGLGSVADVDAVAVTVGPGLEICLRVGCESAKALAMQHAKPFIAVHHLEAHVLMARLACEQPPAFPFLTLLVSGGHCMLLLSRGIGDHLVIGSTLDDALGEAYDKVARLLGLPIGGGGGPALERLARDGDSSAVALPVPMQRKKNFDFSFAGLKTAVRLAVQRAPDDATRESETFRADVAASFQDVAIRHLEQRLKYAMGACAEDSLRAELGLQAPPTALVVSGGVAANQELRRRLQALCDATPTAAVSATGGGGSGAAAAGADGADGAAGAAGAAATWELVVPPPRLCTDNGVMVAWAAIESLKQGGQTHEADGQEVRARWPLGRVAPAVREALAAGTMGGKGKKSKSSKSGTGKAPVVAAAAASASVKASALWRTPAPTAPGKAKAAVVRAAAGTVEGSTEGVAIAPEGGRSGTS